MATFELSRSPAALTWRTLLRQQRYQADNGKVFSNDIGGSHWGLRLEYRRLTGAQRRDVWTDFQRLNGLEHNLRIELSSDLGYSRTGTISGTARAQGAVAVGASSIRIDGFSGTIKKQDFISIGNRLYCALGEIVSGELLDVMPKVREPIANNAIVAYSPPVGIFMLSGPPPDFPVISQNADGWIGTLSVDLEEDLQM